MTQTIVSTDMNITQDSIEFTRSDGEGLKISLPADILKHENEDFQILGGIAWAILKGVQGIFESLEAQKSMALEGLRLQAEMGKLQVDIAKSMSTLAEVASRPPVVPDVDALMSKQLKDIGLDKNLIANILKGNLPGMGQSGVVTEIKNRDGASSEPVEGVAS